MTNSRHDVFVETKHYRRFKEFCDNCRRHRYIGVCYGLPGVGKTLSARHYASWDRVERYSPHAPDAAVMLDAVCGSTVAYYTPPVVALSPGRVPSDVARLRETLRGFSVAKLEQAELPRFEEATRHLIALGDAWHREGDPFRAEPSALTRAREAWHAVQREIAAKKRAVPDPTELIIIDEADFLKFTALEQMRTVFDRGDIGMVLIGMPGLEKKLARYPQLYSRVGFVHEYAALSQAEVRTVLAMRAWRPDALPHGVEVADEGSISAIIRITCGNFRLLYRLLTQIGRLLEVNGLDAVTLPIVEAARESLVIGVT